MKIITAVALLSTLLPFSAQAGFFGKDEWEKEDCPKNHSLAWCLADYQGRSKGIRDMSREEFAETLKKAGVDESHIGDIIGTGLGVGAGLGNLALGNLLGGGVFLLHALMPGPEEINNNLSYIVFFDDGDKTRSEKQISDELITAMRVAIKDALPVLPKEAIVEEKDGHVKVLMPEIDCKGQLKCAIFYETKQVHIVKKVANPQYLGPDQVFSSSDDGMAMFGLPREANVVALAKKISEGLPPWVYWYIPKGNLGGSNPLPMFLNQGKALFFVKPSPGDTAAVLPHLVAKQKANDKPVEQAAPDAPSASGVAQTSSLAN